MFLEAFCRLWYRKEQSPINPGWKTKHQCMQTSNIWQLNLQPVEKKALLEPLIVTFLDVSFHQWRVWKRRTCSAFHLLDESRWEAEERNDLPGEGNVIKQYFTVVLFLRCAETPGPMGNSHKHKYKWVSLWIRSTWLMPVPAVHLQTSHNHLFPSHHLVRAAPSNFPVLKAHNCRLRKAFPIDGILLRSAPSPPPTLSKRLHLWQSRSPPILSESTCQTPAASGAPTYMRMSCDSGGKQKEQENTPFPHTYQRSASRASWDLEWRRDLPWSGVTLNTVSWFWPNIPVSVRLCNIPPPTHTSCGHSGTVKADVASWVASEGRRRSPRGEREADISGTLDVMEMGNWTTGCTRCLG